MTKFTLAVHFDEETNDYVLPFPEELLKDLGWNIGDTLVWVDNKDGTFTIKNKEKSAK